jgi:[ribosomal protein S18]-alanine N-acetyltransferase
MQTMPDHDSIVLRVATLDDACEMAELHANCFPRGWDRTSIATFVADPSCVVFLASTDETSACRGFVIARAASAEAEILTLAVDPAYRRQGLARALLMATVSRLRPAGVTQLFLEVECGNKAAEGLYRSFGAKPVGSRPAYYERGTDAAIFSLALSPGTADDGRA